jgi:predicted Rossmann fold flavoprotein
MFPVTDDSRTIINCLERAAETSGVETCLKAEVEGLEYDEGNWKIELKSGKQFQSRAVLLATGGTRNNAGVKLAGDLGHTLVAAAPSLFTFKINDSRLEDLSGISVAQATASIPAIKTRTEGACLITHWGLSGPTVLKLSAHGARELAELDYQFEVIINWCGLNEPQLLEILAHSRAESPKKRVRSGVSDLPIPGRLWQRLVDHAQIGEDITWANLSKAGRHALVRNLLACRFKVDGKSMNKEEFVTAGGVDLKEVNFKTMESRVHAGLFFAGEVLDIDGVTGGFNFQAAWTTARIAGESAVGVS